ncbi:MAG: DoxX family protein [Mycobacterium sp.]
MTADVDLRTSPATSDFGLLVLRVAAGATMIQAGLIKALDFGTVTGFMEAAGWQPATAAGLMVTLTEIIGGIALMLGVLTPLAACAITAAMMDAWAADAAGAAFWSDPFTVPFLVAFAAIALLFTGAGRFSLDQLLWGRAQWPTLVSVTLFVVAIAAAVATWVLLNGTNPLHLSTPPG